ncbi:hypothetical protein Tco_0454651 [Tanacetum coccineum]
MMKQRMMKSTMKSGKKKKTDGREDCIKMFDKDDSEDTVKLEQDESVTVIMEYLAKISKKARILELKQRHSKITVLTSYTPGSRIEEVMAEIKMETTMDGFVTNDRADYYSGITRITVNGKNVYELKGKFLDDLLCNTLLQ